MDICVMTYDLERFIFFEKSDIENEMLMLSENLTNYILEDELSFLSEGIFKKKKNIFDKIIDALKAVIDFAVRIFKKIKRYLSNLFAGITGARKSGILTMDRFKEFMNTVGEQWDEHKFGIFLSSGAIAAVMAAGAKAKDSVSNDIDVASKVIKSLTGEIGSMDISELDKMNSDILSVTSKVLEFKDGVSKVLAGREDNQKSRAAKGIKDHGFIYNTLAVTLGGMSPTMSKAFVLYDKADKACVDNTPTVKNIMDKLSKIISSEDDNDDDDTTDNKDDNNTTDSKDGKTKKYSRRISKKRRDYLEKKKADEKEKEREKNRNVTSVIRKQRELRKNTSDGKLKFRNNRKRLSPFREDYSDLSLIDIYAGVTLYEADDNETALDKKLDDKKDMTIEKDNNSNGKSSSSDLKKKASLVKKILNSYNKYMATLRGYINSDTTLTGKVVTSAGKLFSWFKSWFEKKDSKSNDGDSKSNDGDSKSNDGESKSDSENSEPEKSRKDVEI